ncbi:hypothetical protein B296_00008146, partial [Ensete ventricosum]
IGKLVGNVKGDRQKEDQRTCHKITRVCGRFDLHPKKIGNGLKKEDSEVDVGRWH